MRQEDSVFRKLRSCATKFVKCLDSHQAAELLQAFLTGRGYGVSPQAARDAAGRVGNARASSSSQKENGGSALAI